MLFWTSREYTKKWNANDESVESIASYETAIQQIVLPFRLSDDFQHCWYMLRSVSQEVYHIEVESLDHRNVSQRVLRVAESKVHRKKKQIMSRDARTKKLQIFWT